MLPAGPTRKRALLSYSTIKAYVRYNAKSSERRQNRNRYPRVFPSVACIWSLILRVIGNFNLLDRIVSTARI